jgi:hypothetical protein
LKLLLIPAETKFQGNLWGSLSRVSKCSNHAVHEILPFTTTYMCEIGYSYQQNPNTDNTTSNETAALQHHSNIKWIFGEEEQKYPSH